MSRLPDRNGGYRTKEYWDQRYTEEGESDYDWFLKPEDVLQVIKEFAPRGNERILMLGAGNSGLSESLYELGYHDIVNVDFSQTLLDQMSHRHRDKESMKWVLGDIRHLDRVPSLLSGSFDLAIDKGTMDALLTGQESVWQVDPDLAKECHDEVEGVRRLLRSSGTFVHITFAQPHFRKKLLLGTTTEVEPDGSTSHSAWTHFETRTISKGIGTFDYFAYIMRK